MKEEDAAPINATSFDEEKTALLGAEHQKSEHETETNSWVVTILLMVAAMAGAGMVLLIVLFVLR